MKILGYTWKVIVNLITIFIVISIFDIASSDFETAVFAILILIYLSINAFASSWGIYQIEFSEALENEFKAIKSLINSKEEQDPEISKRILDDITYDIPVKTQEEYKQEIETDEKDARSEKEKKKNNIMIKFYINIGFQFIVYIIALYQLLSVF